MIPLLTDLLHLFVIFMMGSFIILSVVAATGEFDHWTTRYAKRKVKRTSRFTKSTLVNVEQNNLGTLTTSERKEVIIKRMRERALQKSA